MNIFALIVFTFLVNLVLVIGAFPLFATPPEGGIYRTTTKVFTIQVNSFKDARNASREISILTKYGLDSYSRYEAVKDKGMWYRVYVGRFATGKQAENKARKLKSEGIISWYWVRTVRPKKDQVSLEKKAAVHAVDLKKDRPLGKNTTVTVDKDSRVQKTDNTVKPMKKVPSTQGKEDKAIPIISSPEELKRQGDISPRAPGTDLEAPKGPFGIAVKAGAIFTPDAEDFIITRNAGGVISFWEFKERYFFAGLVPSYRLTNSFSMESSVERAFATNLDLWYLTLGTKAVLRPSKGFTPYFRGALVWGDLRWKDAPGSFDSNFGWEAGIGLDIIRSKISFGLEAVYRDIEFDYNSLFIGGVSATQDKLDFSSFIISGSLIYKF